MASTPQTPTKGPGASAVLFLVPPRAAPESQSPEIVFGTYAFDTLAPAQRKEAISIRAYEIHEMRQATLETTDWTAASRKELNMWPYAVPTRKDIADYATELKDRAHGVTEEYRRQNAIADWFQAERELAGKNVVLPVASVPGLKPISLYAVNSSTLAA